jgi:DNA polymerase III epsilon subunit-like protein
MANYRDIIVFDFETGSRYPKTTQPTQIAAVALHGRKLTLQPNGVFNSEIRPLEDEEAIAAGLDPLQQEALDITGKNREDLRKAPSLKSVWGKFTKWVDQFNFKKTSYYAPIAAGYNINNFDLPIIQRLAEEHGNVNKEGKQTVFNMIYKIDLMDMLFLWTENNKDVSRLNMDYMRDYLGLPETSKANAHDALYDVIDTANILIKFMKFQRSIAGRTKFEKAFGAQDLYIPYSVAN